MSKLDFSYSAFDHASTESLETMGEYILSQFPGSKSKFVYHGGLHEVCDLTRGKQSAYIFQGQNSIGVKQELDSYIVFTSLEAACYFVAEEYMQSRIFRAVKSVLFSGKAHFESCGISYSLLEESLLQGIGFDNSSGSAVFEQMPFLSGGPSGYYLNTRDEKAVCKYLSDTIGLVNYLTDSYVLDDAGLVDIFAFHIHKGMWDKLNS